MLNHLSSSDARRIRDFLREADYTETGLGQKPFLQESPSRQAGNLPWVLEATAELTAFNVLTRLFLLGLPQAAETVEAVFPGTFLAVLSNTGMVRCEGASIKPTVKLSPVGDLIIAADPLFRMQPEQAADIILWPNDTTRLLLNSCVRGRCDSTLDLGSGCGVISLCVSPLSGHVVATDINARTAEFVPFNAWLNSVDNIETIIGDTFEPVETRRFDRILANPPFFITASSNLLYCENPLELDGYCRRVTREAAAHLNEGGFLQMVFEWVQVDGERWQDRLSAWVENSGCDAWIFHTNTTSADAYAHHRTNRQYSISPEKATREFDRLIEYYARHKVQRVLGGLMALRRRSGTNWVRMEEGRIQPGQQFGDLVREVFETQDVLQDMSGADQLLDLRPRLCPQSRLDQQFTVENRAWACESIKLTLNHALPAEIILESSVADFLARCDGSRSLGELVLDLVRSVKADPEEVRQQCCAVVRKLAEKRFVTFPAS